MVYKCRKLIALEFNMIYGTLVNMNNSSEFSPCILQVLRKVINLMRSNSMQLSSHHLVWNNNVGSFDYRSQHFRGGHVVSDWLFQISSENLSKNSINEFIWKWSVSEEYMHALYIPTVISSCLSSGHFHHGLRVIPELYHAIY